MTETIAEALERAGTDTVNHRGRIVKSIVRLPLPLESTIIIRRLGVGSPRPQALKLAVATGMLGVNGVQAQSVALWSHTAPDEVSVEILSDAPTTLEVWNAWSMGGVDSAWIGNAGIVTKSITDGVVLNCSDGIGAASFSDLHAEIRITSRDAAP